MVAPIPGSSTVACPDDTNVVPALPVFVDGCGKEVTPTGPVVSPKPLCEGTRTYTWTYVDCNNVSHDWVYTYTVERVDFVIATPPGASTVACPDQTDVVPEPPVVTDACGGQITPTGPVVSAKPVCEGTRTYTWTYTDCAGHSHDWVYTYTVEVLPFTITAPSGSATVECPSAAVAPVPPVVKDNCGNTLTPGDPVISGTYNDCEGTRIYSYPYTDCEGNRATWNFTYTIDRATPPAEVGGPVATTRMVETLEQATPPTQLPVVHDVCGNVLQPADPQIVTSGDCDGNRKYIYTYTDCAGLSFTWTFTHVIRRTTPPAEMLPLVPNSATAACRSDVTAPSTLPVVKDVNGVLLTPTAGSPEITTVGDQCEATVKYTYHYVDCAGLTFDWVFSWSVKDNVAPQFVVPAAITITADADCSYNAAPSVTGEPTQLSDNCSDELTTQWSDEVNRGAVPGEWIITRTWTVTDECGNATLKDQLIKVVGAGGPPELKLPEFHCVYLTKYGKWTLGRSEKEWITAGSSAHCGSASDLTFKFSRTSFSCADIFAPVRVKVTATDGGGNSAEGYFNVLVYDTISPVALCRNADLTLDEHGQAFLFAGNVDNGSSDNCSIDQMILSKQLFTTADIGEHQVMLTIVDGSGNTDYCTATVHVHGKATAGATSSKVNLQPTIADVAGVAIVKEPLSLEIPLTKITAGETDGSQNVVSITASSNNPSLFRKLNVDYIPGEQSGMLTIDVVPGVSGEALVTLTVKDNGGTANGGVDTTVKQFIVTVTAGSENLSVTVLDVDRMQLATGIVALTSDFGLKVWPNPTRGRVNIDMTWNNIREIEVIVYNILGVEIFRKDYKAGEMVWFDLSEETPGMYIIRLDIEGTPVTHKVILDRK